VNLSYKARSVWKTEDMGTLLKSFWSFKWSSDQLAALNQL